MLIDATHPEETRVVVVDGARIEEFDYESVTKQQIAGNIYLAKVTRVEPSLQAAFVDYGGNRHGFLAFAEIHPDYYQIPALTGRLSSPPKGRLRKRTKRLRRRRRPAPPNTATASATASGATIGMIAADAPGAATTAAVKIASPSGHCLRRKSICQSVCSPPPTARG